MRPGFFPSGTRVAVVVAGLVVLAGGSRPASAAAPRSCVPPSGTDDTLALQAALDRCTGGRPSCVVALCPGTFHTAQLRVRGFRGVLRGAGSERTVIRSLPRLEVNENPDGFYRDDPFDPALPPWPYLLQFFEGRVMVRDLTIDVPLTVRFPERPYDLSGAILFTGKGRGSYSVRRVRILARPGGHHVLSSLRTGIVCAGLLFNPDDPGLLPLHPLRGRCRVTDSVIQAAITGVGVQGLVGGHVKLARNRVSGGLYGFSISEMQESVIRVLQNTWGVYDYGLVARMKWWRDSSGGNVFRIEGNRGDAFTGPSILFDDQDPGDGAGPTALLVAGNQLYGDGVRIKGAEPLWIQDNWLFGRARTGIAVDDTVECRVRRNYLRHLNAHTSDYFLGPETRGCVARVHRNAVVQDDGRGNRVIRH